MIYRNIFFRLFIILILCYSQGFAQRIRPTINDSSIIHLADPTIFPYKGMYYLYGTVEGASGNGFLVYTSADLEGWELSGQNDGYALKKGEAYGTAGFWAPQVFLYNDTFYMAYVANENIAIAKSNSPLGPFTQATAKPLEAPVKQIDPFLFIDEDGKKYLYCVRLTNGNKIFVAQMTDDLSAIIPETLKECITATDGWENTAHTNWPVTEGPSVLKHKGLYYLFYTANDFRNPDYAVGYATSNSPLGPWKKYAGNPILFRVLIGENGTGHGDFFRTKKQLFYVFHTHNTEHKVGPRKTGVIKMKFGKNETRIEHVIVDKASFHFLRR